MVRSRGLSLESFFRRSSLWCFFQLDFSIKTKLFFGQKSRRQLGMKTQPAPDKFTYCFGTIVPSHIPDSTAW